MCYYGNRVYESGDIFHSDDGCNLCVCGNGYVGCTSIECPNTGKSNCPQNVVCFLCLLHIFRCTSDYSKTCLKQPLKKKTKIGFSILIIA